MHAILIEVHCTNIVVNWTKLETLNASRRPHVLHHCHTLKPQHPLAIILGLCSLFTVLVFIKESRSQGRQHAKHWDKPSFPSYCVAQPLVNPSLVLPSLHSHCHEIGHTSQVFTTTFSARHSTFPTHINRQSSIPSIFQCINEIHAHRVEETRYTNHIRHRSQQKNGQNIRQGQEGLFPAQEPRAGFEQRFLDRHFRRCQPSTLYRSTVIPSRRSSATTSLPVSA